MLSYRVVTIEITYLHMVLLVVNYELLVNYELCGCHLYFHLLSLQSYDRDCHFHMLSVL